MISHYWLWVAPPNWPPPPPGWAPPPGWQPDPSWGPPPEGWQFWQLAPYVHPAPVWSPPPAVPPVPTKMSAARKLVAAVIAVLATAAIAGAVFTSSDVEIPQSADTAVRVCQDAVEARLKTRSPAVFGGKRVQTPTEQDYRISGYVDAENPFGADVRHTYSCRVYWRDGEYSVEQVLVFR